MPRERIRVTAPSGGDSRTKQADALASDINNIMDRFVTHGQIPETGANPTYGDFSQIGDLHSAMNRVQAAQDDFDALPSSVRRATNNDPGEFLDMVYDPDRRGELEKLGLVENLAPAAAPPAKPEEPVPPKETAPPAPSPAPV